MKGIIKLLPIENPVESIQVVFRAGTKFERITKIEQINPNHIYVEKGGDVRYYLSELKQIVVEWIHKDKEFLIPGGEIVRIGVHYKILPLHPEDWEKALPLIGKEVEFAIQRKGDISEWAELVFPKQEERTYTRQEVVEILAKYHEDFKLEHEATVLETLSRPRWPSPRKWMDKNFKQ